MSRDLQCCTALTFLCLLIAGCTVSRTELTEVNPTSSPLPTSTPAAVATATPTGVQAFRVVGYVTEASVPAAIPYDKLTHINYAFLLPNPDGTFEPLANGERLKEIVERAHQPGVKVLISIGGWGWDEQFEAMAASPEARATFVRGAIAFANEYQLDGVDVDWEYPDAGESARNFSALMHALYDELHPQGKLLTSAVVALGDNAEGIPSEVFEIVDFLNLMVYDGGPGPEHSPYSYAVDSIRYWQGRGLPQTKTVLGVPFYSRPNAITYTELVQAEPGAAQTDSIEYNGTIQYYNGIPTMKQKTTLALESASGIMIWVVTDDAPGEASLLAAIDRTVNGSTP